MSGAPKIRFTESVPWSMSVFAFVGWRSDEQRVAAIGVDVHQKDQVLAQPGAILGALYWRWGACALVHPRSGRL